MIEADGIILGSPVYFAGISGTLKCFLDRSFYVCTRKQLLRHKVGSALVVLRRSGGLTALDSLTHFLTYAEMILPTSTYWPVIHGRTPGELTRDLEGIDILKILAQNMAWLLHLMHDASSQFPPPNPYQRTLTNFIR